MGCLQRIGALVVCVASLVFPQVPRTMNYQGYLTDASENPLSGTYSITFRIYDAATGGNLLWYETKSVTVTNGYFDVQLDLSVNGGDTLKFGRPYWITFEVGSDGEMSPREKLAPVSFSFRSVYADTADYYVVQHDATLTGDGTDDSPLSVATATGDCWQSGMLKEFATPWPRTGWTYTGQSEVSGTDVWETKTPMPTRRDALAAASVDGKIYVLGGRNGTNDYLSTNEEYDPGTDSWITRAAMPTARRYLAAAAVSDRIYAIGGYNTTYLSTNEEYDPSTNAWTTRASMPTARRAFAVAVVNEKIYAMGGADGSGVLSVNEEYDPSTDTWATKASMPTARKTLAAAALNTKIYVIGGNAGSGPVSVNEEYDPASDSWTTRASMPTARTLLVAVAASNGKLYAIGGYDGTNCLSVNEEYDPVRDTWTTRASMSVARKGMAAAVNSSGRIFVIGGYDGVYYLKKNEEYIAPVILYWFRKD